MGVRRLGLLVAFFAGLLLAAACGESGLSQSGFQYLEDEDSGLYAKIPAGWSVTTQGNIDFALVGEDGVMSVLPGESTLPWRAEFDARPSNPDRLAKVAGAIEIQPVDRRLRSDLTIDGLIGIDAESPDDGITVFHQDNVRRGELTGRRIIYSREFSGEPTMVDRMMLSDDRLTTVYEVRMFCDKDCFAENADVIDEIMETFTVLQP